MMEKTFRTPGKVLAVVGNEVGLVAITARDTTSTTVTLEAATAGAEELVERAVVECRPSGGRDIVVVKIPRVHGMKFTRRNAVIVRVDVPTGSDVDVTTASADVELTGSMGGVEVKSASGDITTDDAAGDMRVRTASGDVEVGIVAGDLKLHSASGNVRCLGVAGRAAVTSTSGDVEVGASAGQLDARSTSGNVRLGELGGDTTVVAVSGDVQILSASSGRMHVRSVSGQVEVGIAKGVRLSVDIETMSGTVTSDISLQDAPIHESTGAAVSLTVRSVSGDVAVERAVESFVR
jgi:DUF4097 and DUF4098 domain-containing protein YvlB